MSDSCESSRYPKLVKGACGMLVQVHNKGEEDIVNRERVAHAERVRKAMWKEAGEEYLSRLNRSILSSCELAHSMGITVDPSIILDIADDFRRR